MQLEQTQKTDQTLRVSARLITSSTILHLSADELERTVNQEQTENPALEVAEQRVCLFCGTQMYGATCTVCGHFAQSPQHQAQATAVQNTYEPADMDWMQPSVFYDSDNSGFAEADSDDAYDPLALIPTGETLAEALLQQLEALVPPDDALIAEQLVGNLNSRGYLEISPQEIASYLCVPVERVEYVLSQLQSLEPLGIGARDLRECLLIQFQAISEHASPLSLVYKLIDNHLKALARNQFHEIAHQLKVSEQAVRKAYQYIRTTLHPHPAHIYRADIGDSHLGSAASYIHPDVLIRQGENGFEVELIEEKRYTFGVTTSYPHQSTLQMAEQTNVQHYMHHHKDRARFFVDCINRRWRTLKRVAELIVEYQRDFLARGVRYLHPLTRAEVAARLSLDEGTVSRATANKYALLPNGRLIPLADFFDGSLGIKDMLRELIQSEDPKHRLSDEDLARLLAARAIPLARRTVTKYREEMGIGSSRERN